MITHYTDNRFSLIPVVTGSSISRADLNNRHGGRIKQPQTAKTKGKYSLSISDFQPLAGGLYLFWGHGSGAKEKAPSAPLSFGRRCFAATRSAFSRSDQRHLSHDLHIPHCPKRAKTGRSWLYPYYFLLCQKPVRSPQRSIWFTSRSDQPYTGQRG